MEHVIQIGINAQQGRLVGAAEEAADAVKAYLSRVGETIAATTQVVVSIGNGADDGGVSQTKQIGFHYEDVDAVAAYEIDPMEDDDLYEHDGVMYRKVARIASECDSVVLITGHGATEKEYGLTHGHEVGDVVKIDSLDDECGSIVSTDNWGIAFGDYLVLEPLTKGGD